MYKINNKGPRILEGFQWSVNFRDINFYYFAFKSECPSLYLLKEQFSLFVWPQNGLSSACLTVSSDKYIWNINILFLDRTRDLHTRVNLLYLEIVATFSFALI